MNILVRTSDSKCIARPDTSHNKNNNDYYVPEDVDSLSASPVIFASISKAGKTVEKEFASRYFDSFNFGVILYPDGMSREEAICFDKTAILPLPLYNKICLDKEDNIFKVEGNFEFECGCAGMRKRIEEAIVELSAHTSFRRGDFAVIELQPPVSVFSKSKGDGRISATFCENSTIDLSVKF